MKHTSFFTLSLLFISLVAFAQKQSNGKVTAEIAVGELIDKITILQIKTERIKDKAKLINIWNELDVLVQTFCEQVPQIVELEKLTNELKKVNEKLWETEDAIREKEAKKEFDKEFIEIARSVYYTNDERCAIKRKINELTGSRLFEEKSYHDYRIAG